MTDTLNLNRIDYRPNGQKVVRTLDWNTHPVWVAANCRDHESRPWVNVTTIQCADCHRVMRNYGSAFLAPR